MLGACPIDQSLNERIRTGNSITAVKISKKEKGANDELFKLRQVGNLSPPLASPAKRPEPARGSVSQALPAVEFSDTIKSNSSKHNSSSNKK